MEKYDFGGWATKANLRCSDGRIILKDAFQDNDGAIVPLVWDHRRDNPENVLGHALLKNQEEGVYAYCSFNETKSGQDAKKLVEHGDIRALSIHANQLKQQGSSVQHGKIIEVSLVYAGANPGAFIDSVIRHGEECEEEGIIYTGESIDLYHAFDEKNNKPKEEPDAKPEDNSESKDDPEDETIGDVFNTLNEKQKNVVYSMIGSVMEDETGNEDDGTDEDEKSKGGNETMKHNVFDQEETKTNVLSHSDQESIISLAKNTSVGSFQNALNIFAEENQDTLEHGFDNIENLFPEFKDVKPGAPELITRDQGWIDVVMQKVHKSPISRIRTRQMDVRDKKLRGSGYQKTKQKKDLPNMKLLSRTTDPQTVYVKDKLHRDDIVDITDFDVVAYQYGVMRMLLNEELAVAFMVGDGRDDGDEEKIKSEHIRPIWEDDELYTIHTDVDIEKAKAELQGTNTGANFGENYIYAEAIISAALYSREDFRGSGTPDFYCTPHLLNVMLLARDLNGRRIYSSKSELAAALNVGNIYTAEQFEGLERTDKDQKKHKLLGLFVNLADYSVGSTKGGEITRFDDFDIDFNQYKYLMETRLSGALTRVYSAIALEEPVGE